MLHRWRQRFEPELKGGTRPSQGEREEIERLRSELRDVKAENTLLKKSRGPLREGSEVAVYGLIHAERASIPVARACRVLEVSRSGYYQWLHAGTPYLRTTRDRRDQRQSNVAVKRPAMKSWRALRASPCVS
jgi:hypothetical protein